MSSVKGLFCEVLSVPVTIPPYAEQSIVACQCEGCGGVAMKKIFSRSLGSPSLTPSMLGERKAIVDAAVKINPDSQVQYDSYHCLVTVTKAC